jgi:hypothetical protein
MVYGFDTFLQRKTWVVTCAFMRTGCIRPVHLKEHVIGHAAIFRLAVERIGIQGTLIVEPVAVLIEQAAVVAVMEAERVHAQLRQRVQFVRLGDPVVVFVDPQQELREHGVPAVDDAIAVATVFRPVILSQRQVAVWVGRLTLRSKVAEKFLSVVDLAIVIEVEGQEGIAGISGGPGRSLPGVHRLRCRTSHRLPARSNGSRGR